MTPDTDKREWLGEWIYAKFVQNYEKLLEENKKLNENIAWYEKEEDRLREENKKLKEDVDFYYKSAKQFREENEKLREELGETKNDLEHRDSFFSIMRDVLANEEISNEELASILYCVIHFECGDTDMSKKEVEIAEKFWFRDYA